MYGGINTTTVSHKQELEKALLPQQLFQNSKTFTGSLLRRYLKRISPLCDFLIKWAFSVIFGKNSSSALKAILNIHKRALFEGLL